jgi:hypothetical protein
MYQAMRQRSAFPPIDGFLWGDDMSVIIKATPQQVASMINAHVATAKDCGQVYDTKSPIGKFIHYLQNYFVWAQTCGRNIPLGHERVTRIWPKDLASLIHGKYFKKAERGGNIYVMDLLRLVAYILGSDVRVYQPSVRIPIANLLGPEGPIAQSPVGFPSPSARMWLRMVFPVDSFVPKPSVNTATLGARIVENAKGKLTGVDRETQTFNIKHSIDTTYRAFRDVNREPSFVSASDEHLSYTRSVYNTACRTLGNGVVSSHVGAFVNNLNYKGLRESIPLTPVGDNTLRLESNRYTFKFSGFCLKYSKRIFYFYEGDKLLTTYQSLYHPFLSRSLPSRLLCQLFGLSTSDRTVNSRLDEIYSRFSPAHFRVDLSAKAVAEVMMRTSADRRVEVLRTIGFTPEEIPPILLASQQLLILKDVDEGTKYGSLPDIAQCIDEQVAKSLLERASSVSLTRFKDIHRDTLVSLFISLVYEELNYFCHRGIPEGIIARVPSLIIAS